MNLIIVDDEPLAREGMENLIKTRADLKHIASFKNASMAEHFLKENKVDLIFLDIQMPGINGLEFAKHIHPQTLIIFTTAYSEYALDSYDVEAIGYLLKPILPAQFNKAVDKAVSYHNLLKISNAEIKDITVDFIFIKADRRYFKIIFNKILFIEGLKDYVIIHTEGNKIITAMNLKTIHSKIPNDKFIRVSKSYIVHKDAIDSFDTNSIYIKENEIPIGKVFQENFHKKYKNRLL